VRSATTADLAELVSERYAVILERGRTPEEFEGLS
jgi:hypothetical protein